MTAPVTLTSYDDVRDAFKSPSLTRSLDYERFERDNLLEGVILILHDREHRDRRRVENVLFRADTLSLYERHLFPAIVERSLDRIIPPGEAGDLMTIGGLLAIVLAARTVGLDVDTDDIGRRQELVHLQRAFSRGSGIDAVSVDLEATKGTVRAALEEFSVNYVADSLARRRALLERGEPLPKDLLSTLLSAELPMDDDQLVREAAFFLDGGVDTTSQTFTTTMHHVFGHWGVDDAAAMARLAESPLMVQRCVHEALRLRPTNPTVKRRALTDVRIGDHAIGAGQLLVLDTFAANRDRSVFGDDADEFDPLRSVPAGVTRYGFAFGGGIHACIGRVLAAGQAIREDEVPDDDTYQYGLVTLMVRAGLAARLRPRPGADPRPEAGTLRHTRWAGYPVLRPSLTPQRPAAAGPTEPNTQDTR